MTRTAFSIALVLVLGLITIVTAGLSSRGKAETAGAAVSQQRAKENDPPEAQVPYPCDSAAGFLDFGVIETKKSRNAYLIMVSRPGKDETFELSRSRLIGAEEYVLRRGSDLKYVVATGEPTSGLGRLELYVHGQLYKIMPYEKNAKSHCIAGREGW